MAIFNGGFPATYPQMYPQYQQPFQQAQMPQIPQIQPQQQQPQSSGIIWVSGEAGARGYMVSPNTTVQLWDSDAQVIYLKSADASGMPTLKILDYTIRDQSPKNTPMSVPNVAAVNPSDYVTKTEFDDLKMKFEAFCAKKPVKQQKKEETIDE